MVYWISRELVIWKKFLFVVVVIFVFSSNVVVIFAVFFNFLTHPLCPLSLNWIWLAAQIEKRRKAHRWNERGHIGQDPWQSSDGDIEEIERGPEDQLIDLVQRNRHKDSSRDRGLDEISGDFFVRKGTGSFGCGGFHHAIEGIKAVIRQRRPFSFWFKKIRTHSHTTSARDVYLIDMDRHWKLR